MTTPKSGTADINQARINDRRCMDCMHNSFQRLFYRFQLSKPLQEEFFSYYDDTFQKNKLKPVPFIHRELSKLFSKISGIEDPFSEEKFNCNQKALELYPKLKKDILESKKPFDMALRLAIAGNIMDYGANHLFDIQETIRFVLNSKFAIDHSHLLKQKIKQAKQILYLGDNAGELVFDKLFIETIMHNDLTFAVKAGPVLNDATLNDAVFTGLDKVADIIHNGYDAPSTILEYCSSEFMEIFHAADLIISKGQGNLEGLIKQDDSRIFFLLMAKCDVIAEILNVKRGSFVVFNQKIR
jgi:damage-control phosphatase, subfamily I